MKALRFRFFWLAMLSFLGFLMFAGVTSPATKKQSKIEVVELSWPREFAGTEGKLVVYAPQIESWKDFKKVEARTAVAYAKDKKDAPSLGTFKISADTEVDHESRLVKIRNLKASEVNFPSLDAQESAQEKIQSLMRKDDFFISLDRVLANLERSQAQISEVKVKNDAPQMFVSFKPAILLMVDGQPIWSPIKDSDLKWAVNTNWDLFQHVASKKYYLLNQDAWLESADLKEWTPTFGLPDSFKKLPTDDKNWEDVRKNIPGKRLNPDQMPQVYYLEQPAELIVIQGQPKLEFISKDSKLQWVSNTESDLFFSPESRQFYFLVSGRWFKSSGMNGPWTFATNELPADFNKIPVDHPRGDVRVSVPGTREADQAIILASIPQTAKVEKSKLTADVKYVEEPQFKPIEGTSMSYATNTSNSVIKVGNLYYLCLDAVWFVSKSPNGPWEVADSIPKEVYTIPASSPVHNVTYVYIYESTPAYVTVGYTSGYYGAYYSYGSIVYGTGWYYPPYYHWGPSYYYPVYYPWPATYGMAAWYNPYTGTFGRGAYYYGPYGGAGYGGRYNPSTGTYARGGYAYGPYQARGWAEAYNPRTGTYAQTRQGSNYYSNWGATSVRRGDDWARSSHIGGQEAGAWGYKTSKGNQGFVGYKGDDLYAGRNGNVYRKSENGGWQQWENGNWSGVERPTTNPKPTPSQSGKKSIDPSTYERLNRDAISRTRGTQGTKNFGNWRSSGGGRARSGGGGFRKR